MEKTKKLYRVTLKGMTYSSTGVVHGISYVVAKNSEEAYQKVREHLDEKDLGFSGDRELDKIELIAEAWDYTDVKTMLFV